MRYLERLSHLFVTEMFECFQINSFPVGSRVISHYPNTPYAEQTGMILSRAHLNRKDVFQDDRLIRFDNENLSFRIATLDVEFLETVVCFHTAFLALARHLRNFRALLGQSELSNFCGCQVDENAKSGMDKELVAMVLQIMMPSGLHSYVGVTQIASGFDDLLSTVAGSVNELAGTEPCTVIIGYDLCVRGYLIVIFQKNVVRTLCYQLSYVSAVQPIGRLRNLAKHNQIHKFSANFWPVFARLYAMKIIILVRIFFGPTESGGRGALLSSSVVLSPNSQLPELGVAKNERQL